MRGLDKPTRCFGLSLLKALAFTRRKENCVKFNMGIEDNYASFIDKDTGVSVFVDSFDNEEFEVRIGTVSESKPAGCIRAKDSEDLNAQLEALFKKHQGEA